MSALIGKGDVLKNGIIFMETVLIVVIQYN